jgi:hypothetical protein
MPPGLTPSKERKERKEAPAVGQNPINRSASNTIGMSVVLENKMRA